MSSIEKLYRYIGPVAAATAAGILGASNSKNKLVPITASLTAGLAVLAAQNMLESTVDDNLKSMKTLKGQDFANIVSDIKRKAGLENIPVIVDKNYTNAAYVPFANMSGTDLGHMREYAKEQMVSKDKTERERGLFFNKILDLSTKPKGGIIIGEKLQNPYIVAHEIGHAMIENKKDSSLYNLIQKWAPTVSKVSSNLGTLATVLGVGSSLASMVVSEDTKKTIDLADLGKKLIWGGLATRLAGDVGTLAFENRAHVLGEEILDRLNMPKELRDSGSKYGKAALGTYAMKPLKYGVPFLASKAVSLLI